MFTKNLFRKTKFIGFLRKHLPCGNQSIQVISEVLILIKLRRCCICSYKMQLDLYMNYVVKELFTDFQSRKMCESKLVMIFSFRNLLLLELLRSIK